MANTIQVKRGVFSSLPTLAAGEFGFCTDSHQVFIGNAGTNYELALKSYVDNLVTTGLDVLPAVLDKDLLTPPGSPADGDRYWIGGTGTDAWAGKDYQVAEWVTASGVWQYTPTHEGNFAYVDDENTFYYYTGTVLAVLSTAIGNHAATHTNGTDDIQSATSTQKGLMTSAYAGKLDLIEALADVTDFDNVSAAGAVMEADFGANTLLAATASGTPVQVTIAEQSVLGRLTSGSIGALTGSQLWTVLSGTATGNVGMNSYRIEDLLDPVNDQDAATRKWVADNFGAGTSTFLGLTDTPSDYTDDALKVTRVNAAANAIEFVSFSSTYLEGTPTENEANKAPTSEWAFDHTAASTGVHGAGANTLLHSASVIDGGTFT